MPCDAPAAGAGGQAPSLDVMARQIAAGYRSAGALFGGHSGGSLSADSLDLVDLVPWTSLPWMGVRCSWRNARPRNGLPDSIVVQTDPVDSNIHQSLFSTPHLLETA